MVQIIDNMKNGKKYDGNIKKFGITLNGNNCIVKFNKDNDLTVYTEYIASKLIARLGFQVHTVELGLYKGQVVDIMYDFTSGTNLSLHSFNSTKQSSEGTDIHNKDYTYKDVIYLIDKHLKIDDKSKQDAKVQFWDMFICDAIIGNRDRHGGNWGYLSDGTEYIIAPMYDNGSSLFPGVYKTIKSYKDVTKRKEFLYERTFTFPASLFKVKRPDRSYRSNFYEMFTDLSINNTFKDRVMDIRKRIGCSDIIKITMDIVNEIPIDKIYKRFYIEIIALRYMCIVCQENFDETYDKLEKELEQW
jgi:hypothetical protein